MNLTPQARRAIASAIEQLPDSRSRNQWMAWELRGVAELPADIAPLVEDALRITERNLRQRLETDHPDENEQADILNDVGYIRSILAALGEYAVHSRRAG